jgi:hypothetical protein
MRIIFRPAMALLGRLRHSTKIVLPLGYAAMAYVDIQQSQPLTDVTARAVAAIGNVEPADRRHGADLETSTAWNTAKSALTGATSSSAAPQAAFTAYNAATVGLLRAVTARFTVT